MFKKFLAEIDVLEEFYHSKISFKTGINDTASSTAKSSSHQGSGDLHIESLPARATRILNKIPPHLRIYVTQAIGDYYKQVDEYEQWKATTAQAYFYNPAQVAEQVIVSRVLPEFNMEKNMPVEDDDNLQRVEEW